jgi:hypothetical protein
MGYDMDLIEQKFRVKKENFEPMLAAIKSQITHSSYSWVSPSAYTNSENVLLAFEEWRWSPSIDNDSGDICDLYFDGHKLGDDDKFFSVIAPYVESGSYICMQGEDGALWKWSFHDGVVEEIEGRIVWDDDLDVKLQTGASCSHLSTENESGALVRE